MYSWHMRLSFAGLALSLCTNDGMYRDDVQGRIVI